MADRRGIGGAVQEEAIGGQSVAACPTNFLVVTFEILGEVIVKHETDVGLVSGARAFPA